jgi:hypothetical protein
MKLKRSDLRSLIKEVMEEASQPHWQDDLQDQINILNKLIDNISSMVNRDASELRDLMKPWDLLRKAAALMDKKVSGAIRSRKRESSISENYSKKRNLEEKHDVTTSDYENLKVDMQRTLKNLQKKKSTKGLTVGEKDQLMNYTNMLKALEKILKR